MANLNLSIGFDVERPHGQFAETKDARKVRKTQIAFIRKLIGMLDDYEVPRTFFILGNYLEKCLADFSKKELQEVFNKNNLYNEIQQHSHSHNMIRVIEDRPIKKIVTPEEFGKDLQKANDFIKEILEITPYGLRIPFGYHQDLSDIPSLLLELDKLDFLYVSSDLRSVHSLEAPLTLKRQPHRYHQTGFPNIVEIPSHGWQDAIFTREMALKFLGRNPISDPKKIFSHYNGLLEKALEISRKERPFFISLCLHPWAMMEYDRNLKILKKLINSSRMKNIKTISYGTIAKMLVKNRF